MKSGTERALRVASFCDLAPDQPHPVAEFKRADLVAYDDYGFQSRSIKPADSAEDPFVTHIQELAPDGLDTVGHGPMAATRARACGERRPADFDLDDPSRSTATSPTSAQSFTQE